MNLRRAIKTDMPVRTIMIWGAVAIVVVVLFALVQGPSAERNVPELPYSDLLTRTEAGAVESVRTSGSAIMMTEKDGRTYLTYVPEGAMADTVRRLHDAGVRISVERPRSGPTLGDILLGLLPMFLLIGAAYFFMRQMRAQRDKGAAPPD